MCGKYVSPRTVSREFIAAHRELKAPVSTRPRSAISTRAESNGPRTSNPYLLVEGKVDGTSLRYQRAISCRVGRQRVVPTEVSTSLWMLRCDGVSPAF